MSVFLMSALKALGCATAGVTVMAIAMWLLLRLCRVRSPAIQRFAWLLVLLPGVIVWRMPVVLPVLPPQRVSMVELRPESEGVGPLSDAGASGPSLVGPNDVASFAAAPRRVGIIGAGGLWACAVLVGGWKAGMIVLAARSARSYVAFVKGLPQPLPAAEGWASELQDVCEELGLLRPIPLHVTERLGPALCLAGGEYRLLVPQAAWRRFSPPQRRAILRHELAHYVRGDLWKSLLARLLAWPQWFNPLAWLAVRQFEEAAECACDDAALAAEREDPFDYLRALVELGTTEFSTPTLQAAVHGGSLQCRVRRLLSPTGKDSVMKKLVVIAAALVLAAGGFARIRLATAQSAGSPFEERATSALTFGVNSEEPDRVATAGGSVGAASAKESAAADSKDSVRVATATSAKPSSEAYIDLTRIFKDLHAFNGQMSPLKDGIQKLDQECKKEQARLSSLSDELKATSETARRLQLEQELADGKAKLQAQTAERRQHYLQVEAKIYNEAYEQVRSAVVEYAKEHGIRRVTRSQSIAFAEDKVDSSDRKAVLQRVNRPILYLDGPSESPTDITDAILQRLNGVKTR